MTLTPPEDPGVPASLPPITGVIGGVRGTAATHATVLALAASYDRAGDRMRGWAAHAGRLAADPGLLATAPLSPLTFTAAEAAVLEAATGVHGVLLSSIAYEADAVAVRAAVRAFDECDQLVADTMHALDYDVGRCVGTTVATVAPALLATAAVALPLLVEVGPHLPAPARRRLAADLGLASDAAQEAVDRRPALLQHVVDGSGGLLDGLLSGATGPAGVTTYHPTVARAAGDLALLYAPEGSPRVVRRPDLAVPLAHTTPRCVADLMRHLDQTNALSTPDRPDDQGTLEIQTLRAADGTVRRVVYLPGTDDLATLPWSHDADVRDLPTDLRLIAGRPTTYAAGIEHAMLGAGIRPGEPVLLVGHSQGGMEAAALVASGSPFHVAAVVTAGSPIAQVHGYPPGTQVLSLENRGDVVPLLDGADNPDSVRHVTVQFDDHETSIAADHAIAHYVRGAESVDVSLDPSVRAQVESLHRQGFLSGRVTDSRVFQVTR